MGRGQTSAGNVAVLVLLIAIFLALFILLLPAEDRNELLSENLDTDENGNSEKDVLLLAQSPGLLKPSSDDETIHKIDSVNLFLRDEPAVADLATRLSVSKNVFSSNVRRLTFKVDDTDNLEDV